MQLTSQHYLAGQATIPMAIVIVLLGGCGVGDGRGYLSPTPLSAKVSPPHNHTPIPRRAPQDKCPERIFDEDAYPGRTL